MLEYLMKQRLEMLERFLERWVDDEVYEIENQAPLVNFKRGELSAIKAEIAFLTHALSKIE